MATGSSSSLRVSSYASTLGEVLPLETEPTNPNGSFAVAIMKSGHVVGHLPYIQLYLPFSEDLLIVG